MPCHAGPSDSGFVATMWHICHTTLEVQPLAVQPTAYPLRHPLAQTYLAGAELVVMSRQNGRYLALNETASAVWERCDGSLTVAGIASVLASTFGQPEPEVLAAILVTLSDFHGRDLISVHAGLPDQDPDADRFTVTFFHHSVEVVTDDQRVARNIGRIFGGLLGDRASTVVARVAVFAESGGFRTRRDGAEAGGHQTLQSVVTWVKRQVIRALIDARPDLLWLHAGAVARHGKVLFCLGEGGSGKSTLVMALVEDGWGYLSDDVIAYDPVTGGALPFPLAPFYRTWGDELVEDINVLSKVRFEIDREDVAGASLAVSALVFPSFSPSGPAVSQVRGPASAAVGLADQVLNADAHSGDILHVCADLASRTPAYDVYHTPAAPPVEVARPLLDW